MFSPWTAVYSFFYFCPWLFPDRLLKPGVNENSIRSSRNSLCLRVFVVKLTCLTEPPNISGRPTWAEIDLDALAHNFRVIREHVDRNVRVMAAVKANAYGHGAVQCARILESEGVDWFGVALPE